jgi:hypothetical protein
MINRIFATFLQIDGVTEGHLSATIVRVNVFVVKGFLLVPQEHHYKLMRGSALTTPYRQSTRPETGLQERKPAEASRLNIEWWA